VSHANSAVDWRGDEGLAVRVARGGLATAVGTWSRFLIQFAGTVLIARLLGPTEYGAAVVIAVFGAAALLLRDSGFTQAVIQRRDLTPAIASALHVVTACTGVVLAIVLGASGTLLARAFADPRYVPFAWCLSLLFIASALSAIPSALLARNLEFRSLVTVEVVSTVCGVGVGVGAALMGWGAAALVLQVTCQGIVQCIGAWVVSPWLPRQRARLSELGPWLRHAGHVTLVQLLTYVAANAPSVIASTAFGPRAAGLYNQAYQLLVVPLQQVNGPLQRIAVPSLARVVGDDDRFRRYFTAIVTLVTLTLWPAFACLAVLAPGIVQALFGPAWAESASIFSVLVISGVCQALGYVNTWMFLATGQVRRQTTWALVTRPIVFLAILVGLPWGVLGMAWSASICSALLVVPGFLVARKGTGLSVRDLLAPLALPLVVTAVVAASCWGMSLMFDIMEVWTGLVPVASVSVVVLVASVTALGPLRRRLLEISRLIRRR
jgi:O-antigen/teichoic acid export membrane protein